MPTIDAVQVQLTADIGQFNTGFNQATTSVENFKSATETATSGTRTFYEGVNQAGEFAMGSERGIRRMEMGLAALSAQAVGTSHSVGLLSEGLLLFGGGEAAVIAVLGGVLLIVQIFNDLTAAARESKKATEDLEKALDHFGEHGKLISLGIQAGQIQEHIESIQNTRAMLGLDGTSGGFLAGLFHGAAGVLGAGNEEGIARIFGFGDSDLIKLKTDLAGVNDQIGALDQHIAGKEMETARRNAEKYHEMLVRIESQIEAMFGPLDKFFSLFLGSGQAQASGSFFGTHDTAASSPFADLFTSGSDISGFFSMFDKMNKAFEEQARKVQELGKRIATALVDGITGNLNNLGDLLKSLLEAWINKYLITPFLLTLGIFSPSSFGQYVGQMVVAGIGMGMTGTPGVQGLGNMRLSLNVNVGGAAPDPFSAARDASWQAAFRETALVARRDGFKVPA